MASTPIKRTTTQSAPAQKALAAKAVKAPRRTQEDRSRITKDKLLAAAIEVLLRDGYSGLTMKEVAKASGVSNGALMHHYTTKAELVVEATAMVYEEAIVRGQRMAQTAGAAEKPIEGFITDCMSIYFDWPFLAALETLVVARTDPELMAKILPVMERYRVTCDDIWMDVFKKAGVPAKRARILLNLSLNLVRGMGLNRMWRHDDLHYQTYIKEWIAMANQQLQALK
ncbi:TetR/AcrR family transcriptional regulator [Polaromonas jejuensis]|uniref:TetR/AcrR family transcriptional regulator n=1 Tax=Polaromonas jejuensis TaxID=457502 RepID=A0ABW0QG57_9BURK|nr:TetR/AcrR family transcriptional regulator [Polaromonas jejuensis]